MRHHPSHALLVALAFFLSAASAQKLPWRAREEDVLGGATRVFIVPPDVHVERWTTTSGSVASGTSDDVRRMICGELDDVLEQRKLVVSDFLLCLGEGEATPERQEAIRAVQSRYRELVNSWSKPAHGPHLLEDFRLVEELTETKKMEVDVLIVVTADGTLTSKGEQTVQRMGGFAGAGVGQGLMIHFGVVRARTGELLFFSEKYLGGDFLKHPEGLEKAVQKSVQAAFAK